MESSTIVILPGESVFTLSQNEKMKWFDTWGMRYNRYEEEDYIRLASKKWDEDYLFSWEYKKPGQEQEESDESDDSSTDSSESDQSDEDYYSE